MKQTWRQCERERVKEKERRERKKECKITREGREKIRKREQGA
jgi:hypothetical protein